MEVQKSITKMIMEMEEHWIQNILRTQLQIATIFMNELKSKPKKD